MRLRSAMTGRIARSFGSIWKPGKRMPPGRLTAISRPRPCWSQCGPRALRSWSNPGQREPRHRPELSTRGACSL
jgi:hypothetical protein